MKILWTLTLWTIANGGIVTSASKCFAQETAAIIYAQRAEDQKLVQNDKDIQEAIAVIQNSLNMITDPMIQNIRVRSLVSNTNISLLDFSKEMNGENSLATKLSSIFNKLNQQDSMDWKPQLVNQLKGLAVASVQLRDLADELLEDACEQQQVPKVQVVNGHPEPVTCKQSSVVVAPELTKEYIKYWLIKHNRLEKTLIDIAK